MKKLESKIIISTLLMFALILQLSQTLCLAADPERISVEQLKSLLDSKADVVVVDTRSRISYDSGHIPGAISMTFPDEIRERHKELPLDKTIILYCA